MSMVINWNCKHCGCPLTLDCGEIFPTNMEDEPQLDLTLECGNCDAPILNAFIPLNLFFPIEE